MTSKQNVIDHIQPNGIYIPQRSLPRSFSAKFPELFGELSKSGNFIESLYCYINDIVEVPKCGVCDNIVNFKSFTEGYRTYCSNKCVNIANSNSEEFKQSISKAKRKKFNSDYYTAKYGNVIEKQGENYITVEGTTINKNKHKRTTEFTLDDTIESFRKNYEQLKYKLSEKWISDYLPNVYDTIKKWYPSQSFNQKKWMALNNYIEPPKCANCCKNYTKFDGNKFLLSCDNYNCRKSTSIFEREVYQYVDSISDTKIITNYRVDNKEIDIYLPDVGIGIECNGLYWHSEEWKSKKYHQDKKLFFKTKGITIIYIWEDDWRDRKEIIKSIIKHKIGRTEHKIYARHCKIIEINNAECKNFLANNHIQGYCVAKNKLGLVHKNEIVAVMTFGNRSIVYQKNKGTELLRYASLKNFNIIGGAGKLLNHYIKNYQPTSIISFANFDISDGNLYKKLGFVETKLSEPGYWWSCSGYKYHRSNFMKHILVKEGYPIEMAAEEIMKLRGYIKIWNSGNLVYEMKCT